MAAVAVRSVTGTRLAHHQLTGEYTPKAMRRLLHTLAVYEREDAAEQGALSAGEDRVSLLNGGNYGPSSPDGAPPGSYGQLI